MLLIVRILALPFFVASLLIYDGDSSSDFRKTSARSLNATSNSSVSGLAMSWWNDPADMGYGNLEFPSISAIFKLPDVDFTHLSYWMMATCNIGISPVQVSSRVFFDWANGNIGPPAQSITPNATWAHYLHPLAVYAFPDPNPSNFVFRDVMFVIEDNYNDCHYYVDNVEFVRLAAGCDFAGVTSSSAPVDVSCSLEPPSGGEITAAGTVSPIVNITSSSSKTNVTFILPQTGGQAIDVSGTLVRTSRETGCRASVVKCEWWRAGNPGYWSSEGCINNGTAALGGGAEGVMCVCVHLTLFALLSRSDFEPTPLCHTSTADYVFVALYAVIAIYCIVQSFRSRAFCKQTGSRGLVSCCDTLTIVLGMSISVCILRLLSLILKPFLPVGGLTILYALPSFLQLFTFSWLSITWFSIVQFTMRKNPYEKYRAFLYGLNALYFVCVVGISIAIAATTDELTSLAQSGAYLLAIFSLLLGLSLLISGGCLVRQLRATSIAVKGSSVSSSARNSLMLRSLIVSCLLAVFWCGQAIAGFLAVSASALDTESGFEAADGAFYAFDVLCLVLLLILFQSAINKSTGKPHHHDSGLKSDPSSLASQNKSTSESTSSSFVSQNKNTSDSSISLSSRSTPNLVSPASHQAR